MALERVMNEDFTKMGVKPKQNDCGLHSKDVTLGDLEALIRALVLRESIMQEEINEAKAMQAELDGVALLRRSLEELSEMYKKRKSLLTPEGNGG